MKFRDIILAVLVIAVFIAMYVFSILAVGVKKLKKDWPKYRCNPAVMPFAGQFGHDAEKNFTFCIGNIQQNMMGFFLQPIHYIMNSTSQMGGVIGDAINEVRKLQSFLKTAIGGIVGDIFGIFMNILIQFQRLIIDAKDLAMKVLGVGTTLLYIMDSSMKLGQSIWAGPIGGILRTLCFHPDTPIELEDGTVTPMKAIRLGQKLTNGSTVVGTLKIKGDEHNKYFKIYSKKLGQHIYVTGEHKIQSPERMRFMKVQDYDGAESTEAWDDELSCLITDDHLIPVGEYTFWDWED